MDAVHQLGIIILDFAKVDRQKCDSYQWRMESVKLDFTIQNSFAKIRSSRMSHKYEGLQNLRNLLLANCIPQKDVVKMGMLPHIVDLLRENTDENIQYECAWIVTNLTAADSRFTLALVAEGALHALISLLDSPHQHVVRQAAWALGNIFAENGDFRSLAVELGLIPKFLILLQDECPKDLSRALSWMIVNMCRTKRPALSVEAANTLLPKILWLWTLKDATIRSNAIWSFTYLSESSQASLDLLVQEPKVITMLQSIMSTRDRNKYLFPSLRLLANLLSSLEGEDAAGLYGFIPALACILNSRNRKLQKLALNCLDCISEKSALGSLKIIQVHGLLSQLVDHVFKKEDQMVSPEAVRIIGKIAGSGTKEHLLHLLEAGAIEAFSAALVIRDRSMLRILLTVMGQLVAILCDWEVGGLVRERLESCSGITKLENLQYYDDDVIHKAACEIVDTLFKGNDEDEL